MYTSRIIEAESKRQNWLRIFRKLYKILIAIVIFSWCIYDSYEDIFVRELEDFLIYPWDDNRRKMYLLMVAFIEIFRFISIIFFAMALFKFWSVFNAYD